MDLSCYYMSIRYRALTGPVDGKTIRLGVLTLGDKTGYETKKHFERAFGHFFVAGFGSIYPALGALTRDGRE